MTRIFGLCPRCKSRIRIDNVERLDGRKLLCRDCGYAIRIRDPKQALVRQKSKEGEVFDLDEGLLLDDADAANGGDEFAVAIDEDDEIPAYRPLARRPKAKKEPTEAEEEVSSAFVLKRDVNAAQRKGKKSPLLIGLVCGGALLVVGGLLGGLILLRSSGLGTAAKFETPEKYVTMQLDTIPVTGIMPEGWKFNYGGGTRGIPIYLKVSDGGSISIDVRETVGSSAKGQAMNDLKAGKEVTLFRTGLNEAPSVDNTHEFNRKVVIKDFVKYDEGSGLAIETKGFGEGRISDFTGKDGYFSGTIKGCRASLAGADHQYSIVCKCPPAQFKDVRPVFEKVIANLGTWEKN